MSDQIQSVKFTGWGASDNDFVQAIRSGLVHGRTYEVRSLGVKLGVEYFDVINIGTFKSVMFESK